MFLVFKKCLRPQANGFYLTEINNGLISLLTFLIFNYTIIQFHSQLVYGYGEACFYRLTDCNENEVCELSNNGKGICTCLDGFFTFSSNKTCISSNPEPPPSPYSSSIALSVSITFLVLALFALVGFLHYKYRIFSGVIHSIYRFRRRQSTGQAYQIADDGDDVHPIV